MALAVAGVTSVCSSLQHKRAKNVRDAESETGFDASFHCAINGFTESRGACRHLKQRSATHRGDALFREAVSDHDVDAIAATDESVDWTVIGVRHLHLITETFKR